MRVVADPVCASGRFTWIRHAGERNPVRSAPVITELTPTWVDEQRTSWWRGMSPVEQMYLRADRIDVALRLEEH